MTLNQLYNNYIKHTYPMINKNKLSIVLDEMVEKKLILRFYLNVADAHFRGCPYYTVLKGEEKVGIIEE